MYAGCYRFLNCRILFFCKTKIEFIEIQIIFILNILVFIKLMKTWKVKNGLASHFNFLISDHHLIELKYWLSVFHVKIEGLQLVNNFPNDFCQSQLNFFIIGFGRLQHFLNKFVFNVFWSQLIQKLCQNLKRLYSYIRFFIIQQLE